MPFAYAQRSCIVFEMTEASSRAVERYAPQSPAARGPPSAGGL
jgi:hypothetical protein